MSEVVCLRCKLDKKDKGSWLYRSKYTHILHNVLCERATKEEIKQAGEKHMNNFTKIWIAVQAYLEGEEK
jgi:hypothetical protein